MNQEPKQQYTVEPLPSQARLSLHQRIQSYRLILPKLNNLQAIETTLSSIQDPQLLISLITYLLQNQPESIIVYSTSHLSLSSPTHLSRMQNRVIVGELMRENRIGCIVDKCRTSQLMATNLLYSASSVLIQQIKDERAGSNNLNQLSLLALKILQSTEGLVNSVIEQALRHVLVIDEIQKGELLDVIASNNTILSNLSSLPLSGYLLMLFSKLNLSQSHSQETQKLYQMAWNKIEGTREKGADLCKQIVTIQESNLPTEEKSRLLCVIRGECFFIGRHVQQCLKEQGQLSPLVLEIFQQFLTLKDFICFSFLLPACIDIQASTGTLNQAIIKSISNNCLPIYLPTLPLSQTKKTLQYDSKYLAFLDGALGEYAQCRKSLRSSQEMSQLLIRIMGEDNSQKRGIWEPFEDQLYTNIEKQYEQHFSSHQFLSACNLMCRQTRRISLLETTPEQLSSLKEYIIGKAKWLLNLTETSLPQNRPIIHSQIFNLLLSYPHILSGNDFLQQVLEDLLVAKIPKSFPYLRLLMDYCLLGCPEKGARLREKVVRRGGEGLELTDKVQLWELLLRGQGKGDGLLDLYSLFDEHWIAKYCAFRIRGVAVPQLIAGKVEQIRQKMASQPFCYRHELEILQRYSA